MTVSLKNWISRLKHSPRVAFIALGVAVFFFLLYVVAGFWFIPSYITSKAKIIAKEKWQRELTLKSLEFNPFSFTLDIKGFRLSETKSEETFVSFDQLFIDLSAYSLLKLTPVVTELKLVKPYARIIRYNEKERNFDDIVAFFSSEKKEQDSENEEGQAQVPRNAKERQAMYAKRKFGLYNFQLIDARFELENKELGTKTVIKDFHIGLPLVYRGPIKGISRFVEPKFEAMINDKKLEIVSEKPKLNSDDRLLRLSFNNIDLKRIFNYVPFNAQYQFKEGWLDLNLLAYIHRPRDSESSVDFGGSAILRSLHMTQGKNPLLNIEKVAIDLGTISPLKGAFQLQKIEVIRPEVYVIKDASGIFNFATLLAKANKVAGLSEAEKGSIQTVSYQDAVKPKANAESDDAIYSLEVLEIKNAKLKYNDESKVAPLSLQVSPFHFNLNRIAFNQNALNIDEVILSDTNIDAQLETKLKSVTAAQDTFPDLNIRIGRLLFKKLDGHVKSKIATGIEGLPFAVDFKNVTAEVQNIEAKLGSNDIHCDNVHFTGLTSDITVIDHPELVSKVATLIPYNLIIDNIDFKLKEVSIKNRNAHLLASAPRLAKLANIQFQLEKLKACLSEGKIALNQLKILGGRIFAEMVPFAPNVPKKVVKGAQSPYQISIDKIDIQTGLHLINSNLHDSFQIPYEVQLSPLALSIRQIDANLKEERILVKDILAKNVNVLVTLEDFKKPTAYGARAQERAELMKQIIEETKKQNTSGFLVEVDQVDISNWKAELKNNNKTDRAGVPISGITEKLNLTFQHIQFDTGKNALNIGAIISKYSDIKGQINPHENYVVKYKANENPISIPSQPLAISIDKVDISDWNLKGRNLNLKKSLGISASNFSIVANHISSLSDKLGSFAVKSKVNESGFLAIDGKLSLFPLQLDANLNLKDVSVVLIQPYIDDYINLTLDNALLTLNGNAKLKEEKSGIGGTYDGDISISQMRTSDKVNHDLFSRWDSLDLSGVRANLVPLSVRIREAQMNNFFARIIMSSDGRLNIQNILKSEAGGQVSLTETDQELDALAKLGQEEKIKISQEHQKAKERRHERRTKRSKHREEIKAEVLKAKYPDFRLEKLVLKNGRVRMTDNFIKPNYTANISDLEGVVSPVTLDEQIWSKIDLRGKVNNAPLMATGSINLLKDPFALEVKAKVKGMELAQLSAYASKFIGYGIKKGKMSCDIEYKVENGELIANNRLILDQLTFDEQAADKEKMSLPIQLAVNLLKDSNGVIDINLPIEGALDNPNFSLGNIIAKVLFNSIKSVLFSPFSFLNGSGNSHEAWLAFDAGTSNILAKEEERLEKIATAFIKYPKLKLDITGIYDLTADRKGLAKVALKRQGRMEKYNALIAKDDKISPTQIPYSDQDYATFIKDLYKNATFEKPKNLVFLDKSLSLLEMEDLLAENAVVKEEDFINLAYQRAEKVKAQLVKVGVSDTRIFILAVKEGKSSDSGETATRVDLSFTQ